MIRPANEGEVGDADHPLARIAIHGAEGEELLQIDFPQSGFLLQFAAGGGIERFIGPDESAGQRPRF